MLYILTYPKKSDDWRPISDLTVDNLEDGLMRWGPEYDDVAAGALQAWEYPTGNIYELKPDREIDAITAKDLRGSYYGGPEWKVIAKKIGQDKEKVNQAYEKLTKPKWSFSWFRKK